MSNSELEEIKLTIQKLSDRIENLEKANAANKQYFEYLTDLAISKLTVIPDFALYRENVNKEIESKFSSLQYKLLNEQSQVVRSHLNKLPTDLIEDRKSLFKILNETTKMLKDLSYGIGELSNNFSVKLGKMGDEDY
jgi:hypothetical protein